MRANLLLRRIRCRKGLTRLVAKMTLVLPRWSNLQARIPVSRTKRPPIRRGSDEPVQLVQQLHQRSLDLSVR